jgi:hypothetical protein
MAWMENEVSLRLKGALMPRTAEEIVKMHDRMKTDAKKYQKLKRVCTEVAYPMRSDEWAVGRDDKGKQRGKRLFDATAPKDLEIWSSGIMGYYAPKEAPWFMERFTARAMMASKIVRKWLQELDEHMRYVLNRSGSMGVGGYYEAKKLAVSDSGCIGDSYLMIDEDIETGKLMCQTPHPREFSVRRDYFGRVVEIHREYTRTIDQIREEFGEQALTADQRTTADEDKGDNEITIIQATDRNPEYDPAEMGTRYMKWRSYFVQKGSGTEPEGKVMRQGGYRTLNPIPWSLNRPSHETYGRGIISQVLIEILTANYIGADMLQVSHQASNPTMIVTSALKHRFSRTPGKTIFTDTEGMSPITRVGDLVSKLIDTTGYPFGIDMLTRWTTMIDERFGIPLFLAMNTSDEPAKTATEIRDRKAERVVLMAPFLSTLGSTTDMELDRVFDIELAAGRAPEPPLEVLEAASGQIDIEYIGPLHHLLNQYYGTQTLLETLYYVQQVAAISPDSVLIIEGDRLLRKLLETNNTPEEVILEPNEVAEIRAIAAEQQEAKMMAELAAKAGQAAGGLTKKVDPESILGQVA